METMEVSQSYTAGITCSRYGFDLLKKKKLDTLHYIYLV